MFARISFENQKVSKQELEKLENTLSDQIEFTPYCLDKENKVVRFYDWSHTFSKDDEAFISGKKEFVRESDIVGLDDKKEYLVDLETFISLHPNIKIRIRGLPKAISPSSSYLTVIQQMTYIYDKFENALKQFNDSVEFNQKCDVHISNLGLLHINQTGYAVDCCTENLQLLLNDGWRIIASCVQPDQRRPDYILGRYNPDLKDGKMECMKF